MRILLVEDSERLRRYVTKGLRSAGWAVDTAMDGEEGLWLAKENAYEVIILDLMLPKMDGMTVLQRLRNAGSDTHVLILTAMDGVSDRVRGLEQGADDYLVKPFAFEELLARVQALSRRKYHEKSGRVHVGDLLVDTVARTVRRDGTAIDLTSREYALLELLALRHGEVVTRAEIEHCIYDERAEPVSNVVDSTVCLLRKKIDRPRSTSFIQTRRGMGYVLREPDP
jgi:DNA-binding response OmpR family regulator